MLCLATFASASRCFWALAGDIAAGGCCCFARLCSAPPDFLVLVVLLEEARDGIRSSSVLILAFVERLRLRFGSMEFDVHGLEYRLSADRVSHFPGFCPGKSGASPKYVFRRDTPMKGFRSAASRDLVLSREDCVSLVAPPALLVPGVLGWTGRSTCGVGCRW